MKTSDSLRFKSDPDSTVIFGHGFADLIDLYDWEKIISEVNAKTEADVKEAIGLARDRHVLSVSHLMALLSPASDRYLEEMAVLSKQITDERFGRTISLYIPMYVSNACTNKCVYCGFNHDNEFKRITLTQDEVKKECEAIKELGPFDNLLIVAGEYPSLSGPRYLKEVLQTASQFFHNLTIEVQPLKAKDYKMLVDNGLYGVVCFQETYNKNTYKTYHPHGMKSHFEWRLNGYDRMGEAGVHKIGMGALLGLEDWRAEAVMMGYHLRYLQKKYWRSRYSINFPRMCESESGFSPKVPVTDRDLVKLITAFRLFDPDLDISISTRENAILRNNLIPLGVTSMSAGSKTDPGGYSLYPDALEQFSTTDVRSPREVERDIKRFGYQPVWKDWDVCLQQS